MLAEWPFFASLISNAEMACSKADIRIAERYTELLSDDDVRERIWGKLQAELELTRTELMTLRGSDHLLDSGPSSERRSIAATHTSTHSRSSRSSSCGDAARRNSPTTRS